MRDWNVVKEAVVVVVVKEGEENGDGDEKEDGDDVEEKRQTD